MYLRRPAAVRPGLVQGAIASFLELCTQNRPILKGLLIIVRPPDIQPISVVDHDTDTLPIGDHFQHQLVETERLVFRNQIENFFVDAIDAHAHAIRYPGLLFEPGQISVRTSPFMTRKSSGKSGIKRSGAMVLSGIFSTE